jgi:ribokinase
VTIRVIVLGDLMVDVVVRPLSPVAPTSDTPSSVRISRGGSAANVAAALASADCDVHFAGVVGRDDFGNMVQRSLAGENVTSRVRVVDAPTGVVVAMVAPDAQRAMFTSRGANAWLSEEMALELTSGEFHHLHLSGYTVLGDETRAIVPLVIKESLRRGRSVSVDVCSIGPLLTLGPQRFLHAIEGAHTLLANEEEALALSGTDDAQAALNFLLGHFEEVMISRGGLGALAANSTERAHATAHLVEVIDTTGAGDAASGTYLAARLQGQTMNHALTLAMRAGSVVVGSLGARA